MATAYGPERAQDASPVNILSSASDQLSSEHMSAINDASLPLPNPPFVFPARMASPTSAPPSLSRATGRLPMSAIEPHNQLPNIPPSKVDKSRRPMALPDFSFNPGAGLSPDSGSPMLSPPTSPDSPRTIASPMRPAGHGHRRGGSEFVGGRIREGNSIAVMSTSPTKSESGFASPSFQPPRRTHRRGVSGTISVHELPSLHPPWDPSSMKGSSAPTSPTTFDHPIEILNLPNHLPRKVESAPASANKIDADFTDKFSDDFEAVSKPPSKPPTRTRVGFSDTLEFIPRPLSLVSSDTSSVATARPGHSLSGSISSIVSAASVTSPSGRESPAPITLTSSRGTCDSRPSTAGAILERSQDLKAADVNALPKRRNSIPALLDVSETGNVAPPSPSPSKAPKRWSFFALEALTGSASPTKTRPTSSSSSDTARRAGSGGSSSDQGSDSGLEAAEAGTAKAKKQGKKDKKRKSRKGWTGSILTRKGPSKKSTASPVRPPTPPATSIAVEDDNTEPEVSEKDMPGSTTPTVEITEPEASSWTKLDSPKRSTEDPSHQMIDLDAALGPFNTPLPHNPEWEAAQRAAGNTGNKRRLHSAQGMKGFTGPGMHYHRRAESAPDLPPFDAGRSSIHRFGSSSTMADVFEEDEEDEESANRTKGYAKSAKRKPDDASDGDVTPPAITSNEAVFEIQDSVPTVRRMSSGLSDKDQASMHSIRAERSRTSLQENVIAEEPAKSPVFATNIFHSATNFEPVVRPCSNSESQPIDIITVPVNHPSAIPISPYSMSHASSFPSPRSPISVDAQRISTAPSSVAEENNFQSLLMGEPGPEVRLSMDYDIPSLTSSNSTMTRDSTFMPQLRRPRPGLREQRPASVSSAMGRRRSSLASLSRLISSSHGERSKLSMEVTLANEAEKKARTSKSKRLSKLMQFWKSDKQDTTG
ncbi:hypothetical protein S40285_03449 [Stachybotrys chlorohalonatus IBT 40285]|uniref:Cell wall proline rich protein n=1 Tax=Stachybotrys chlorohalonatus (strain IBT 40285) TaxID=1283841 RepID=A0A084QBZ1_STAC4|nr:hypothetical protein S40285_03449 [Stachybotrys chlorohalonata IBT 40285]